MASTERTGRECIDRVRHNTDEDANSEISRVRCAPVANADSLLLRYCTLSKPRGQIRKHSSLHQISCLQRVQELLIVDDAVGIAVE